MAFGGFDKDSPLTPMVEINTTPLVDVMLVLLVIFIITAPLLTHAVKVDLPHASSETNQEKPDTITLALDATGQAYWDDTAIAMPELEEKLAASSRQLPQPELRLRADKSTPYQRLAEIMAAAHNAGMQRIGFVMEPK